MSLEIETIAIAWMARRGFTPEEAVAAKDAAFDVADSALEAWQEGCEMANVALESLSLLGRLKEAP
jgi:hypothetical protein